MDYHEKGRTRYKLGALGVVLALAVLSLASCGKRDEPVESGADSSDTTDRNNVGSVSARIVIDTEAIQAGNSFRIGVLLSLIPHAHVYWRNPGDSGFATDVEWTLPEGYTVGPLQWPRPQRFYEDVIDDTSYGYEDEVLLFAKVTAPQTLDETAPVLLGAKPNWLVCLDDGQCIPGGRPVDVTLDGTASDAYAPDLFERYASRMSRSIDDVSAQLKVKFIVNPRVLILTAAPPWEFYADSPGPVFFPYEGDPWKPATRAEPGVSSLAFETSADGKAAGEFVAPLENSETGAVEVVIARWGKPPIEE